VNSDFSMEAIRNDLESEDVFSIAFCGGPGAPSAANRGSGIAADASLPLSMAAHRCDEDNAAE
jgi:hypothetical protein